MSCSHSFSGKRWFFDADSALRRAAIKGGHAGAPRSAGIDQAEFTMMILGVCLLALLGCAVLSVRIPVVQFAIGLVVASLAGLPAALANHVPLLSAVGWLVAILAAAQIGYVLGLACAALVEARSRRGSGDVIAKPLRSTALRPGEK